MEARGDLSDPGAQRLEADGSRTGRVDLVGRMKYVLYLFLTAARVYPSLLNRRAHKARTDWIN
jgi:hypothetical protein